MSNYNKWSFDEIQYLHQEYENSTDIRDISKYLGRTSQSVYEKARRLNLQHPQRSRRYSKDELDSIINLKKQGLTYKEISALTGRSQTSLKEKFHREQLTNKFTPNCLKVYDDNEVNGVEYLKSIGKENARRLHDSVVGKGPADATYTEGTQRVGVNIKSGYHLFGRYENLEGILENFDIAEILWNHRDNWTLLRIMN